MSDWTPVESVAKNDKGEYMALVSGQWIPAQSGAKNEKGEFVAYGLTPKEAKPMSGKDALAALNKVEPTVKPTPEPPMDWKQALKGGSQIIEKGMDAAKIPAMFGGPAAALLRVPGIASKIPALANLVPKTMKELGAATAVTGAAGAAGEGARQLAEKAGAGPATQGFVETVAPFGVGAAGVGAGKLEQSLMDRLVKPGKVKAQTPAQLREDAARTARGELKESIAGGEAALTKEAQAQRRAQQQADSARIQRERLEGITSKPTVSNQEVGTQVRQTFESQMEAYDAARKAETAPLLAQAQAEAKAKEAAGEFINTKEVRKPLEELARVADGNQDIQAEVKKVLSAVGEATKPAKAAGEPKFAVEKTFDPRAKPEKAQAPKTYEQLDLTRQYLNYIVYGKDRETYTQPVRKAAKEAVKALEDAMGNHTNAFKQFKDKYREMSRPMDTLDTKLGRLLSDTEGGITEGAYHKVDAEKIPARVFKSADSIEMLVDALAGGKAGPTEARAAAEKTVGDLAMKYFEENLLSKDAQSALKAVTSPELRPTMERLGNVGKTLQTRAQERAARGEKIVGLKEKEEGATKTVEEISKRSDKIKKDTDSLKESFRQAETMEKESPEKALKAYEAMIKKARTDGILSAEAHDSAIAMINRAETMEKKLDEVKKRNSAIIRALAYSALGGGVGAGVAHKTGLF